MMLAKYGIYLRDKRFHLCNVILDLIVQDAMDKLVTSTRNKKYGGPVGDHRFRSKRRGGALGDGDPSLLDFVTFSPLFHEINHHMQSCEMNDITPDWTCVSTWSFPKKVLKQLKIDEPMLSNYARRAIEIIKLDFINTYNFIEWKGDEEFQIEAPTNATNWARETKIWKKPFISHRYSPTKLDRTEFETLLRNKLVEANR